MVDESLCGGFDNFDPAIAPSFIHRAPAGLVEVSLSNSEQGVVMVPVESGVDWSNIEDAIRRNHLQSLVTCSSGYVMNFRGDCVNQTFNYTYGAWPTNTLAACSGTQVFTRTYLCIDEVTGISVDYSFCDGFGLTPDINRTYLSPVGNGTMAGTNGDVLNIHCQEGKTQLDVGNGTVVSSVASCGSQRHLANSTDLACTANSYVAAGIVFPTNDMEVGTGSRVVNSTSFTECRTSHDNQIVAMSYCSGIDGTQFTQTQLSPAGDISEINAEGDAVTYTIAEGGTRTSPETVVVASSCGTDRHLVGSLCLADTFTPSDFVFPSNDMEAGDGSRTVTATGFNTCTRDHDSVVVDNTRCSLPAVAPTQTQLSPAGDKLIAIDNAVGGGVLITLTEGQDFNDISSSDLNDMIDSLLSCESGYDKDGLSCVAPHKKLALLQYGVCSINNVGNVYCAGQILQGEFGTNQRTATRTTPVLTGFTDIVKVEGNNGEAVDMWGGGSTTMGGLCAMKSTGDIYCSGNYFNASFSQTNTPRLTYSNAKDFSYDLEHGMFNTSMVFCYINQSNQTICSGKNEQGQFGNGTIGNSTTYPQNIITSFPSAKKVYASSSNVCVMDMNNEIWCAGSNSNGIFGTGANVAKNPTPIKTGFGQVKKFDMDRGLGTGTTCVINMTNDVLCSGGESSGSFGLNRTTSTNHLTPQITGFPKAKDISVGAGGTICVVSLDNKLYCSGRNNLGQMGDGTTANSLVPKLITQWGDVKSVVTNGSTTCAEKVDGSKACTGYNANYQLGRGNNTNSATPVNWND
jgi:alpha-tubulin suppressor-like RCC1 family protein